MVTCRSEHLQEQILRWRYHHRFSTDKGHTDFPTYHRSGPDLMDTTDSGDPGSVAIHRLCLSGGQQMRDYRNDEDREGTWLSRYGQ